MFAFFFVVIKIDLLKYDHVIWIQHKLCVFMRWLVRGNVKWTVCAAVHKRSNARCAMKNDGTVVLFLVFLLVALVYNIRCV